MATTADRFRSGMRELVERLHAALDRDGFLDECLDLVVELFGADRGLIVVDDGSGTPQRIHGRRRRRAMTTAEVHEISSTIVRSVRRSGRCVVFTPDAAGEATESIATLGIVAALAAPLRVLAPPEGRPPGGAEPLGVIYVDFREPEQAIGPAHEELFELAATLVALVIGQSVRLARTREDLRATLACRAAPEPAPALEELLAPRSMDQARRDAESCLHGDLPVLILGESGTGKTLLARAIAEASRRTPIVRATLGASDDLNTIASELFGHERGAFSGALIKRLGLVELAGAGTLILDEILNLPVPAQKLLLDLTQFGSYRPLGYGKAEPKQSRARLISVTNGDVAAAVRDGGFREDLYYRIAGITIVLPPLRRRREEIPLLAERTLAALDPGRAWRLAVEVRRRLVAEDLAWPGNVRQLETVIRRARGRALARDPDADTIEPEHLDDTVLAGLAAPSPPEEPRAAAADDLAGSWRDLIRDKQRLEAREHELIERALEKYGGVVAHAAAELGVARTSLLSRIQTLQRARQRGEGS